MQLKTDPSQSPTFNYFIKKMNQNHGENSVALQEAHKEAMDYIKEHYPKAKPGTNYWLHKTQAPLVDQYFLRYYTFRSCIPPYTDEGLNAFEKKVEAFVQNEAKCEVELERAGFVPLTN